MPEIFFDIFGRDHNVGKTFDGIADKGHHVSNMLGGIAGAAAGIGLAAVFKTGYEEATDAERGVAQLEAGIKSTGNAAHVTVGGMTELAGTIQEYSGQTDDSIVKTEQLLLTFTNIRNVGPDKIFDQATIAAADMAAKFGGDASQQAIVLGKALNDPVRGLTALRRVGVAFTKDQEAQIKALVKTGDTMGAQKIILGELNKEFGGSAAAAGKTLPGQLAIARRSFEDVSQGIVENFLPALKQIVGGVQGVLTWFKHLSPEMKQTVTTLVAIAAVAGPLVLIVGKLSGAISSIIGLAKTFGTAFSALNAIMAANPIMIVVIAIAALVAALVIAYNNVGWFKDFVDGAFKLIQQVISVVVNYVTGTLVPNFQTSFNNISNFITGGVTAFSNFSQGVSRGIQDAINWVTQLPGRILSALSGLGGLLLGAGASIMQGFLDGLQSAWKGVTDFVGGIGNWIAEHKGPRSYDESLLTPHGGWIMGSLSKGFRNSLPELLGTLGMVTDTIGDHFSVNATANVGTYAPRGGGAQGGAMPAVYVQNPFTGEYLLAKVGSRADAALQGSMNDLKYRRADG